MTHTAACTTMLLRAPFRGIPASLCGLAAITAPTLVRASLDGVVSGTAFSPYVPFVLLCALLLEWKYAAAVALVSVVVADMMFVDPRYVFIAGPTDVFGMFVFLATSALAICLVCACKTFIQSGKPIGEGIVFSLEQGQAWASWYRTRSRVRLGSKDEVAEMMKDFLAQLEVGERLTKQPSVAPPEAARSESEGTGHLSC
jgi:hypothetical protein